MKLFCIRKLRVNARTTAHSKAESVLRNVKARIASTVLAGFRVESAVEKEDIYVEVNT